MKRHGCKVLMTKLGWLGEPHAANIPWWLLCSCNYRCYLGSCMVTFGQPGFSSSPASSSMLSFAGGMGEKGSLPPAKPSSRHSSLALVGGEGIKCPLSSPPPSPQPFYGGSGSTRLSVWEEMVVSCLLCKLPLNLFAPSEGRMGAKLGGVLFPLPLISPAPLSVSKVSWKECSPLFFQDLKWPLTTATKGANKKLFSHHKHVCWLSLRAPLG